MKKWYAIPAIASVLVIGGVAFAVNAENGDRLTTDQVKEKAVAEVGGTVREIELERENSKTVYEVDVNSNGVEYDLKLDASTGEVLKKKVDDDDDDRIENTQGTTTSTSSNSSLKDDSKVQSVATTNVNTSDDDKYDDNYDDKGNDDKNDDNYDDDKNVSEKATNNSKLITTEQAIAIAKKQASGDVIEIELDEDDNRYVYEIEMYDGTYEYDFEIDAVTGKVLEFEKEREDD